MSIQLSENCFLYDCRSTLRLKREYGIWHPTLEFDNLLKYEKQEVYGDPDATSFVYEGNQILSYSEEVKLVISCDFRFNRFPFDTHNCQLTFGDDIHCIDKEIFINNIVPSYTLLVLLTLRRPVN